MKQLPLFLFILFFTVGVGLTIRLYSEGKILSMNKKQTKSMQANLSNTLNTIDNNPELQNETQEIIPDGPAVNGAN